MEILGKLSKLTYDRRRVKVGLRSIRESFNLAYPTVKGLHESLGVKEKRL